MANQPINRKGFLTWGARLLGGVVLARPLLDRLRLKGLAVGPASQVTRPLASSGQALARLRNAYSNGDVEGLISLLHPKVEWRGVKYLPWERAPA